MGRVFFCYIWVQPDEVVIGRPTIDRGRPPAFNRPRGDAMARCRAWLLVLLAAVATDATVIQRLAGANRSELAYLSAAGGSHVYISGTDVGSAFAPPSVYVGDQNQAECVVQPFTSNRNRLHCIIDASGLPPPPWEYKATGSFVEYPLKAYKGGRRAQCWHVGGVNHDCRLRYPSGQAQTHSRPPTLRCHGCVCGLAAHPSCTPPLQRRRFDVGGTPRIYRVLTREIEPGGFVRVVGDGIDGGLVGDQKVAAILYRGDKPVLGACGEKDCQVRGAPSRQASQAAESASGRACYATELRRLTLAHCIPSTLLTLAGLQHGTRDDRLRSTRGRRW